jgi:nucleotide-binding universal stress UspA family protein
MSYRTILVNVETGHTAGKEVELAANLARQYGATLIGLAAGFLGAGTQVLGGIDYDLLDIERDKIQAEFKAAETRFGNATKAAGLKSEWRTALEFPVLAVARAAVAADLVLVGRARDSAQSDRHRSVVLGDLLMCLGRPVLVVPTHRGELNVRDVVVGWKDSVGARRALSDALPFLKRAEQVNVIEIGGDGTSLRDAKAFLDRHDVHARTETLAPVGKAGSQLVRFAEQAQSDLIVVGAYGHSRLRELVLGGVTRELLDDCPIPCLFSH